MKDHGPAIRVHIINKLHRRSLTHSSLPGLGGVKIAWPVNTASLVGVTVAVKVVVVRDTNGVVVVIAAAALGLDVVPSVSVLRHLKGDVVPATVLLSWVLLSKVPV